MNTSRLVSVILCTGVALMAFGATYWPVTLGYLAASPGTLLTAFALLLLPLTGRALRTPTSRNAWRLLGWGLLMSVVSIAIFGWSTFYAAKSASLLLLSAVWLAPLLCIDHLRMTHLRRALWIAIVISALGYVVGDVFRGSMPDAVQNIMFGGEYAVYPHTRPRGFMQETSHFATLVGRDLFMLYLLYEASRQYSPRRLVAFLIGLSVLLFAFESKGAAVSIAVAVLSISLTRRQLSYLVVLAPLVWWLGMSQVEVLTYDIENFTSTSTRLTLGLTSVAALLLNPMGYGYYGFYGAIEHFGGWAMVFMGERLPLIQTELTEIVEDLINVSAKSTLLDFGIVFGLPFFLMLTAIVRRVQVTDPRARSALVYLLVSSLSTSGHESISLFFGLAVLLRLFPKTLTQPLVAPATGNKSAPDRQYGVTARHDGR